MFLFKRKKEVKNDIEENQIQKDYIEKEHTGYKEEELIQGGLQLIDFLMDKTINTACFWLKDNVNYIEKNKLFCYNKLLIGLK